MALTDWRPLLQAEQAVGRVKARRGDPIAWGDVRVAHLDTGYTFHPALGFADPADALNPGDLSAIVVEDGKDFLQKQRGTAFDPLTPFELWDGFVLQEGGHGTRPATVMAGDQPARFKGVAPGLPLLPCRVTEGSVLLGKRADALAAALRFVAGPATARPRAPVAAICLGRLSGHAAMGEAVDACYEKGVIIVAACGQLVDRVTYPARYARAIGAGGLEKSGANDPPQPYYRYESGTKSDGYAYVDVWAPASGLRRGDAAPRSLGAQHPNYDYGYVAKEVSGTTYACAHVAAAAALWLVFHGEDLQRYDAKPWQRVEAFRHLLKTHNPGSRFSGAETQRLKRHGNTATVLNIDKLLQAKLPDPAILKKGRT